MRKFILLITTISLVICLMPFNGNKIFASSVEDDFIYEDNQTGVVLDQYYPGGVTITGDSNSNRKDLVIPATLGGKPVTTLWLNSFQNKQLTTVNMSNNVKLIAYAAFQNNQLSAVTLSNQLEWIGYYAFYNNNLSSITIPSSMKQIGEYAFIGNDLKTITIFGSNTALLPNSIPNDTKILGVIPSKAKEYADSNGLAFEEIGNKITYDGNGQTSGGVSEDYTGSATNTFIVKNQGSLKKIGFTFMGWNAEQDGGGTDYSVGAVKTISGDLVLYAKWQLVKYEVTFNANGGSTLTSQMVAYNTKATEPLAPTKQGYTFDGWYREAALTNRWDFTNDVVNGPTTLHAKWQAEQYEVTFNANGGSTLTSQMVDYNTKATEPSAPTKQGYTFDGWYKEAALTNRWDFTNDAVNEPTTLYAKWKAEQYEVTFNANGGSTLTSQMVAYNTKATEPSAPTKQGYTFDGWYTEAALTNRWDFTNDVVIGATTLYAKWKAEQYEVTFNANGGSTLTSQMVDYNTKATEPSAPTKQGYIFDGWYTEAALTNRWDFTNDVVIGATTLYAKWKAEQYEVTFNANGGSTLTSQMVDYNTKATEPSAPTKQGYTFDGWYKEAALTNRWDFTNDAVNEPTTLYAKWQAEQYEVTFNTNGGTTLSSEMVDYNTKATEPSAPTKQGYTFDGWYTEAALTNRWDFTNDVVIGATTLYAKWKAEQYEVTFNANGGSTLTSQMVDYNTKATEPSAPTKQGYTFDGWYKEAALTNRWDFTNDAIMGNTTLYAKWVVKSSGGGSPQNPLVYFDSNGGDLLGNLSVAYDTKLAELPIPVKNGFTFGGWYKEAALINLWDSATDRVTKDTKLYAKWIANTTPEQPIMTFNDTIDHWAKDMIGELAGQGIITGYPDGSFRPNEFIQRQHVALLFNRAFEFEPTRQAATFLDVDPNNSYYEAIMALQQAGIVDGSGGKFNPTAFLTRAQMAKIVALALKLEPGGVSAFQDVPTAHWSYAYIATLEENGIVLGDNSKFRPDEPVTRAEIVTMLYRALNLNK